MDAHRPRRDNRRVSATSGRPLVVVTGGAGFIGSHTVDRLVAEGCQVVVLDDFSTGKRSNLAQHAGSEHVEIVESNVADGLFGPLHGVTRRRGAVERIVHLAAQTSVVYSIDNPLDEVRSNYVGTVQVIEYARLTGVKKIVFASSAAVYGDSVPPPVREDGPGEPLSPYGIDKRSAELWLRYAVLVHGMAATPLRFFNVYGPRQDPGSPYSGVISIFVDRAMAGRELTIFGDGEQTRDFVFVADVAGAVVRAVLSDDGDGTAINIGTGSQVTINQLAATVNRLCGSSLPVRHAEARPGEIRYSMADIGRARERLGYRPTVALEAGLQAIVDWVGAGGA
jgi:UDP-glucose 4-epimerase